MRKKIVASILSLGVIVVPLFSTPTYAAEYKVDKETKMIYKTEQKEYKEILKSGLKDADITINGKTLKPDALDAGGALTNEKTKEEVPGNVKQGIQLLEMKQVDKDTYEGYYVSVTEVEVTPMSEPTSSIGDSDSTSGGTVSLKTYFHTQYTSNMKHYDMNYVVVDFSSTGGTVSGRYVNYGQSGYSYYKDSGLFLSQSGQKSISSNSSTTIDAPDSWVPIFKGVGGSNAHGKVSYNGSTYKLDAYANFLNM